MKKDKIKVLHIDTEQGWRGGQQQAVYLFESMVNQGYETTFACKPNSKLASYFTQKKLPFKTFTMKNELDFISAFKIASFCKKDNYQILHLHSAHAQAVGILTKLFNKNLQIIAVRRVDFNIKKNFLSQLKYKTKLLDKIVCISNGIKSIMLEDKIKESNLSVIHSGVDLEKFKKIVVEKDFKNQFNINNEEIIIGTIAALAGHKDYPNFLQAAKIVVEQRSNIRFLAVGSGIEEKKVKDIHKNLNLGNKFIFTGQRNDVGKFLKIFDIFVMPSKKEGLGTSILDAQALGLPVIGTKTGGIPEAVQDNINGLLVKPQHSKELAVAIIDLIDNKQKREKFGKKALETVQFFDIKRTVERNINLYKELLGLH